MILKFIKTYLIHIAYLFAIFVVMGAYAKPSNYKSITVVMIPAAGQTAAGVIVFTQEKNDVLITGKLTGLTPGKHGMHIHENVDCSDTDSGFKKAGTHFNPTNVHHGSIKNGHIGDLGNITANSAGDANFKIKVKKFNLKEDDEYSILGRSIMVHANVDDVKTDPAGNSGERILCGEIK